MIATGRTLPWFLERAKTQTLTLELHDLDGVDEVASATITIYDESASAVVNADACTVTNDTITYSLTAATVPATLTLSDRWQIKWAVTNDAGEVHTVYEEAHLCLSTQYPVINEGHLRKRHSSLTADLLPDDKPSYAPYLVDAWEDIQAHLLGMGKRPYLVLSSWSLKKLHLYTALGRIFRDLSTHTRGPGKYAELADYYDEKAEAAWAGLTFDYDYDEDGTLSDDDEEQVSGQTVVFLNGNPGGVLT